MFTHSGLRQDSCCLGFLSRDSRALISSTLTKAELQKENGGLGLLASDSTFRTSRSTGSVSKSAVNASVFTASVGGDLQAALRRSQEVQGLHQLQVGQPYQGAPENEEMEMSPNGSPTHQPLLYNES